MDSERLPSLPWEPPSLALAVGDRVAVRLSGEGDADPRLDGLEGVVAEHGPPNCDRAFPYLVEFAVPGFGVGSRTWAWLARAELRRVSAVHS